MFFIGERAKKREKQNKKMLCRLRTLGITVNRKSELPQCAEHQCFKILCQRIYYQYTPMQIRASVIASSRLISPFAFMSPILSPNSGATPMAVRMMASASPRVSVPSPSASPPKMTVTSFMTSSGQILIPSP